MTSEFSFHAQVTSETIKKGPVAYSARELARREVGPCVSSLVSALAQGFEKVQPRDRDTNAFSVLAGQAYELAAPVPDCEQAAREAGWMHVGRPKGWQPAKPPKSYGGPYYKTAEALCHFEDIEPVEHEVYEHWIVSGWLADKLISNGEKVDKNFAGLCVWARTRRNDVDIDNAIVEIAQENSGKRKRSVERRRS